MIKSLLSPVQKWFLKRGQCVGCGMPLKNAELKEHSLGLLAKCKCGRSYFQLKDKSWRRALQSELK
jgi:hypothetical protein